MSAAADDQDPHGLREQIVRNQETIDRLNLDLAKRANDVRIIQQISSEITSTLNLDEVLDIVLGAMERVLGFRHSMLLLAEPAGDTLVVAATRGRAGPGGARPNRRRGHRRRRQAADTDARRQHRRQFGTVTNLAARLRGEAKGGEILASTRLAAELEDIAETEEMAPLTLKGFARPVPALKLVRLKPA